MNPLANCALLIANWFCAVCLSGTCDLQSQQRLQRSVDMARARVRALVQETHGLRLEPTQQDIEALQADGYVGEVLQQLKDEQAGPNAEKARDALLILARLLDGIGAHGVNKADKASKADPIDKAELSP